MTPTWTLPTSVRILGKTFTVEPRDFTEDNTCTASINLRSQRIWVAEHLHQQDAVSSLFHEIMHAIEDFADLDMSEQEIDVLAYGMFAVLADNADLVLRLCDEHADELAVARIGRR